MFRNLQETIKAMNADINNVANSEKAINLRKKLLRIGVPMAIIGFTGVFVCFVLFATAGFSAFGENGFTARILVPFVLFIPFGIVGGIGASIASLGFKITITGYTTNLIDETVGNNCPNCGETIQPEMLFCSKCGTKVRKECKNCNYVNDHKSEFCSKCGKKLD